MIDVSSYSELKEKILAEKDEPLHHRFTGRLVFCGNAANEQRLVEDLPHLIQGMNIEDVFLTVERTGKLPTLSELQRVLKQKVTHGMLFGLFPLLCLWEMKDIQSFFSSVWERDIEHGGRYYVLLPAEADLMGDLRSFQIRPDQHTGWNLLDSSDRRKSVYLLPTDVQNESTFGVSNAEDWFDAIETQDSIIATWDYLSHLPDSTKKNGLLTWKTIKTWKQAINELIGITMPYDYYAKDASNWKTMYLDLKDMGHADFTHWIQRKFNIQNFRNMDDRSFLDLWLSVESSPYSRWLLKNQWLAFHEQGYLPGVLKTADPENPETLIQVLWFRPMHENVRKNELQERRRLLCYLHRTRHESTGLVLNQLENYITSRGDRIHEDVESLLTDITEPERATLLSLYRNADYRDSVNAVFPDLYGYENWETTRNILNHVPEWVGDYFSAYNHSRIIETPTDSLSSWIHRLNRDHKTFYQWYHDFDPVYPDESIYTFFMDGLGVEWLPFMLHLLENPTFNPHYQIKEIRLCRAQLPTTTSMNQINSDEKFVDLDQYIHRNHYERGKSLIIEIETVKKMVGRVLDSGKERLQIIADHGYTIQGLSFMGGRKKYDLVDHHHEGRYALATPNDHSTEDYIVHSAEENGIKKYYKIALRGVGLTKTPSRVTHGGATPEEALVPHLILEKPQKQYVIDGIAVDTLRKPTLLSLRITPEPDFSDKPVIALDGYRISSKRDEGNYWGFELPDIDPGKTSAVIQLGSWKKRITFDIPIQKGFQEEDLF